MTHEGPAISARVGRALWVLEGDARYWRRVTPSRESFPPQGLHLHEGARMRTALPCGAVTFSKDDSAWTGIMATFRSDADGRAGFLHVPLMFQTPGLPASEIAARDGFGRIRLHRYLEGVLVDAGPGPGLDALLGEHWSDAEVLDAVSRAWALDEDAPPIARWCAARVRTQLRPEQPALVQRLLGLEAWDAPVFVPRASPPMDTLLAHLVRCKVRGPGCPECCDAGAPMASGHSSFGAIATVLSNPISAEGARSEGELVPALIALLRPENDAFDAREEALERIRLFTPAALLACADTVNAAFPLRRAQDGQSPWNFLLWAKAGVANGDLTQDAVMRHGWSSEANQAVQPLITVVLRCPDAAMVALAGLAAAELGSRSKQLFTPPHVKAFVTAVAALEGPTAEVVRQARSRAVRTMLERAETVSENFSRPQQLDLGLAVVACIDALPKGEVDTRRYLLWAYRALPDVRAELRRIADGDPADYVAEVLWRADLDPDMSRLRALAEGPADAPGALAEARFRLHAWWQWVALGGRPIEPPPLPRPDDTSLTGSGIWLLEIASSCSRLPRALGRSVFAALIPYVLEGDAAAIQNALLMEARTWQERTGVEHEPQVVSAVAAAVARLLDASIHSREDDRVGNSLFFLSSSPMAPEALGALLERAMLHDATRPGPWRQRYFEAIAAHPSVRALLARPVLSRVVYAALLESHAYVVRAALTALARAEGVPEPVVRTWTGTTKVARPSTEAWRRRVVGGTPLVRELVEALADAARQTDKDAFTDSGGLAALRALSTLDLRRASTVAIELVQAGERDRPVAWLAGLCSWGEPLGPVWDALLASLPDLDPPRLCAFAEKLWELREGFDAGALPVGGSPGTLQILESRLEEGALLPRFAAALALAIVYADGSDRVQEVLAEAVAGLHREPSEDGRPGAYLEALLVAARVLSGELSERLVMEIATSWGSLPSPYRGALALALVAGDADSVASRLPARVRSLLDHAVEQGTRPAFDALAERLPNLLEEDEADSQVGRDRDALEFLRLARDLPHPAAARALADTVARSSAPTGERRRWLTDALGVAHSTRVREEFRALIHDLAHFTDDGERTSLLAAAEQQIARRLLLRPRRIYRPEIFFLERTAAAIEALGPRGRVTIGSGGPGSRAETALFDPADADVVLVNLLGNAVKHGGGAAVHVDVSGGRVSISHVWPDGLSRAYVDEYNCCLSDPAHARSPSTFRPGRGFGETVARLRRNPSLRVEALLLDRGPVPLLSHHLRWTNTAVDQPWRRGKR